MCICFIILIFNFLYFFLLCFILQGKACFIYGVIYFLFLNTSNFSNFLFPWSQKKRFSQIRTYLKNFARVSPPLAWKVEQGPLLSKKFCEDLPPPFKKFCNTHITYYFENKRTKKVRSREKQCLMKFLADNQAHILHNKLNIRVYPIL